MTDTTQETVLHSYGTKQVRTIQIGYSPYFVATDVCNVLDIKDTSGAVQKLDDDEKLIRKLYGSGQRRKAWLVNESGLYRLIFRSNKPEAEAFRKWVFHEVLPSIRKTGGYSKPETQGLDWPGLPSLVKSAIAIAGNQTRLANRIGISPGVITFAKQGDYKNLSTEMQERIQTVCRHILEHGIAMNTETVELLMQVEDTKVRTALFDKMKKGGML